MAREGLVIWFEIASHLPAWELLMYPQLAVRRTPFVLDAIATTRRRSWWDARRIRQRRRKVR